MVDREAIPTISGPGAVLGSLILLALILTSDNSRKLAFNWEFDAALVVISLPISIFITQVYHALFMKFGHRKKNWGEKYEKYKKSMNILDNMADYLCYKQGKGDKEWVIIQKRAATYSLHDMLRGVTILFILIYTICLIYYFWINNVYGQIWYLGVSLTYLIAISCTVFFWLACKNIWDEYMILDRKIIKDIESDLDSWIKEEISKNK